MSWLFKLSNKKSYIGNCVHGLDDEQFMNMLNCYDATQLAQFVDSGTLIDYYSFTSACDISELMPTVVQTSVEDCKFFVNGNIMWIHDLDKDIHYFFA